MSRRRHTDTSETSDISSSTYDEILSACNDSCSKITKISTGQYCPDPCPPRRVDPVSVQFTSVITPLSNLTPLYSGCTGSVEFTMRRKNKTITLQWEPFSGNIGANGIAFLTVTQSICNTPPYPLSFPIYLEYKTIGRITHITIDPHARDGNIKIYLNTDGSATDTNIGDAIFVPGSTITWIVDD